MRVRQSIITGFFSFLIFSVSFSFANFLIINLFISVYQFMCVYIFALITFKILGQGNFTLIQCLILHLIFFFFLLSLFINITTIFTNIITVNNIIIEYLMHQFSSLELPFDCYLSGYLC